MLEGGVEPTAEQEVVRVVEAIGGNMVKIETAAGEEHLCRLPQRFSRVVFVKRGSLLLAHGGDDDYETSAGKKGKVKYLADAVLLPHHLPRLVELGVLPEVFRPSRSDAAAAQSSTADLYSDDLVLNRNRNRQVAVDDESDDSDAEESA